jgi:hypothetical protein
MATLAGATIASTYPLLLKIKSGGIDGSMKFVQDGDGTDSAFKISTAGATVLGTLTVGVDDTGADVQLFGATTGHYLLWDQSEDDLILAGANSVLSIDSTVASTSITTGSFHTDGGAGVALDLYVGNDLLLKSDSSKLSFGADSEVYLTHVHNEGLLLNSTNKIQFYDSSQFIQGSSATALSIGATAEIDLTATAIDINGTADVSGTLTVGGILTVNNGAVFNEASADVDFRVESNGNANMLFVDAGNNRVGIGTATPDGMLDISSSSSGLPNVFIQNSSTSQQTGGALIFTNIDTDTNLGDNIIIGEILVKAGDPSDDALINAGRIKFQMDGVGALNDINGKITFETGTGDGTLTERLTIKAAGNIGVGTDTPDTKLEVVGSFAANGPSSTFVTMSSGDTSPDVSTGNIFKSHGDGVTIDQFDGGICGQIITIISGGATVYDVTSSELNGGTTNITTAAGDVTMWVCESATDWHLLSWMDLSIDLSSGGF